MDVFFDSNIVIYALAEPGVKTARANQLLRDGGIISVQVLNECVAVAQQKLKLQWPQIRMLLASAQFFCGRPHEITLATHTKRPI